MHSFHSFVDPQPACYDCHPGATTQCSRSLAHTAVDGNCTTCHGNLSAVGSSGTSGTRTPWINEPSCASCHQGVPQVDTGTTLYRNATGHGNLYCPSCHGSPHAQTPSRVSSDNLQDVQYQGKPMTLGDCRVCHKTSRGGGNDMQDFAEEHGGLNPRKANSCNICHTSVSTDTAAWPHSFQWKTR